MSSNDHGWRACPSDEVRRRWEAMGGEWQIVLQNAGARMSICPADQACRRLHLWRPVHSECGWNHEAWMWAAATGEALVPTEPGWWWRDDETFPVRVELFRVDRGRSPDVLMWKTEGKHYRVVTSDGHWLGPCITPRIPEACRYDGIEDALNGRR